MRRTALLYTAVSAVSVLAFSTPVLAQGSSATPPAKSSQAAPASTPNSNSESSSNEGAIIVTALRQSQKLQDVPASVSVLTATDLKRTGATNVAAFAQLTPGVTVVTGTAEVGDTQIDIRGMNGARDAESSVALVVDGILKTNIAELNQDQGTLEQVEVLKGPQGAIYGRNAAAGAIIIKTLEPTPELSGAAKVSYGEHNTFNANAHLAGPFNDTSGFVISGQYDSTDGFYRNSYLNNQTVVDDHREYAVEGRLMFGMQTATTVDIKARYSEYHGASINFNSVFALQNLANITQIPAFSENVNNHTFRYYSNIRPTNKQTSFNTSIKIDHELKDMKLTAWALYSNVKQSLTADGTSADFGRYLSAVNPAAQPAVDACYASTAALTGYPINPPGFINVRPTSNLFDPGGSIFGAYSPTTCDGTQYQIRNQEDGSAEIRLASDSPGPLQWQVGAYYLHINRTVGVSLGADEGQGVTRQLYNAPGSSNPTSLLLSDKFLTNVYSAFGSANYDLTSQVTAGLALRFDSEHRKDEPQVPNALDPFTGGPINPGQQFGPLQNQSKIFNQLEPKISLSWKPMPTMNIYGSWGIGFKSGGFNNQGSAALINEYFNNGVTIGTINANVNITDQYKKETSSAFELGIKGSLLDDKLSYDLAGYYTRVTNMQFFEFFVGSFGLLRVVSNIDKVDIKGVEADLSYRIVPGWRIYASGNVTDSTIKKNSARPYTVGNKSPYTSDYTLNLGTEVTAPVGQKTDLLFRADYRLTGPTWFSTVQCQTRPTIFSALLPISNFGLPASAGDANYCSTQRNAYGILNLRAGVSYGNFNFTVFANNALDKKYISEVIPAIEFGGSFVSPGAQRVIGAEISAKF